MIIILIGKKREFDFTDHHSAVIKSLVYKHTGIKLSEAKKELVYGRIIRRLRA